MARRNPNGAGSYYVLKNGTIRYTVMVGYYPDGRPRYIMKYGKTRKEAKHKADLVRMEMEQGLDVWNKTKFKDFAEFWYATHKKRITKTTAEGYRYALKKIIDCFGERPLKDIRAYDVEQFLDWLQDQGYADSYVRQMRGMLFQIFNKAEANDLIRKNPVRYAEKVRSRNYPVEKESFSAQEVRLLMRDLPEDLMGHSIRILLCTGMRMQELLALEPRFIAEDGSYIYVRQAVKLVKGTVEIGPPKSRDSLRDIPVPKPFWQDALYLRNTDKKFIWEVGKPGVPCNPTYFRDKFKEAIEKVDGVRILTPHSCRHTYVSMMQSLGVDVPTIQSICGHAEVDMTQHYLHVQESVRQAAVEKYGREFLSSPGNKDNQ